MAALTTGTTAPDFALPSIEDTTFSLKEALARGPVVLAFFKISCPICQYTFPFLQRIYESSGGKGVTIMGVSQNNRKHTQLFLEECGVTFPVLLDDTITYPVSNAYGLTNVPTVFWIAQDGGIEISSVGWVKQDIEDINRMAAGSAGKKMQPVFHPDEEIAAFRAG